MLQDASVSKSDTNESKVRHSRRLNRGIARFLSTRPNWGRAFVSDLDTAQHIVAGRAVRGAVMSGA